MTRKLEEILVEAITLSAPFVSGLVVGANSIPLLEAKYLIIPPLVLGWYTGVLRGHLNSIKNPKIDESIDLKAYAEGTLSGIIQTFSGHLSGYALNNWI